VTEGKKLRTDEIGIRRVRNGAEKRRLSAKRRRENGHQTALFHYSITQAFLPPLKGQRGEVGKEFGQELKPHKKDDRGKRDQRESTQENGG